MSDQPLTIEERLLRAEFNAAIAYGGLDPRISIQARGGRRRNQRGRTHHST